MILGEIIQRIQSLYSKGVHSDDSRLSSRHIYNKLLTVRAKVLTQEANKKQRLSEWNYQTIPCVEMIKVPAHDCPCIPPFGCKILRSKHKLPEPLTSKFGNLIQSVVTIDRAQKIDAVNLNSFNAQKGNKYTSKKMQYFIQDGYLYISTSKNLKVVMVVALFEDPLAAEEFKGFCDTDCEDCTTCTDPMLDDFPMDTDLIETLIELSTNELLGMFGQGLEDLSNNAKDSLENQSK